MDIKLILKKEFNHFIKILHRKEKQFKELKKYIS